MEIEEFFGVTAFLQSKVSSGSLSDTLSLPTLCD